jgi:hypothetical protein
MRNAVHNRRFDIVKEECRNIISEALQGLDQFEEAEEFNKQTLVVRENPLEHI